MVLQPNIFYCSSSIDNCSCITSSCMRLMCLVDLLLPCVFDLVPIITISCVGGCQMVDMLLCRIQWPLLQCFSGSLDLSLHLEWPPHVYVAVFFLYNLSFLYMKSKLTKHLCSACFNFVVRFFLFGTTCISTWWTSFDVSL